MGASGDVLEKDPKLILTCIQVKALWLRGQFKEPHEFLAPGREDSNYLRPRWVSWAQLHVLHSVAGLRTHD